MLIQQQSQAGRKEHSSRQERAQAVARGKAWTDIELRRLICSRTPFPPRLSAFQLSQLLGWLKEWTLHGSPRLLLDGHRGSQLGCTWGSPGAQATASPSAAGPRWHQPCVSSRGVQPARSEVCVDHVGLGTERPAFTESVLSWPSPAGQRPKRLFPPGVPAVSGQLEAKPGAWAPAPARAGVKGSRGRPEAQPLMPSAQHPPRCRRAGARVRKPLRSVRPAVRRAAPVPGTES